MKEGVLSMICKCPDCGAAFIKENGEICNCPEPALDDETPTRDDLIHVEHTDESQP